jgi:hypothetical protein
MRHEKWRSDHDRATLIGKIKTRSDLEAEGLDLQNKVFTKSQRQPKEELELIQELQEPTMNGPINGQTQKH